ncbi:hypothetical protein RIR_jg23308.t1 [Rhizophagus irregularis DAOM 181602=DAOM 197198]|nr:hypothetical protein RIR_jg23308.t1 [Rhizophagus irregularis DAOM 181602=DAOM 197198]
MLFALFIARFHSKDLVTNHECKQMKRTIRLGRWYNELSKYQEVDRIDAIRLYHVLCISEVVSRSKI